MDPCTLAQSGLGLPLADDKIKKPQPVLALFPAPSVSMLALRQESSQPPFRHHQPQPWTLGSFSCRPERGCPQSCSLGPQREDSMQDCPRLNPQYSLWSPKPHQEGSLSTRPRVNPEQHQLWPKSNQKFCRPWLGCGPIAQHSSPAIAQLYPKPACHCLSIQLCLERCKSGKGTVGP